MRSSVSATRRSVIGWATSTASALLVSPACASVTPALDWQGFKARFVSPDGRVQDHEQGGVSHSEGQGFGLIFAVHSSDRQGFEQLWTWTQRTLQRPTDNLLSWRFSPGLGVTDANNATDGDILVAWALLKARQKWREPAYGEAASQIMSAIAAKLVHTQAGRLLLLPGLEGFRPTDGSLVLNPSYYVFPALDAFAKHDRGGVWKQVIHDGLWLLRQARFGAWDLPPDWVKMAPDGQLSLDTPQAPRFGYDAVRVPLYLIWSRRGREPAVAAARKWWSTAPQSDSPPAWLDLQSGAQAEYEASPGLKQVIGLVRNRLSHSGTPQGYYDAALSNLASLAERRA